MTIECAHRWRMHRLIGGSWRALTRSTFDCCSGWHFVRHSGLTDLFSLRNRKPRHSTSTLSRKSYTSTCLSESRQHQSELFLDHREMAAEVSEVIVQRESVVCSQYGRKNGAQTADSERIISGDPISSISHAPGFVFVAQWLWVYRVNWIRKRANHSDFEAGPWLVSSYRPNKRKLATSLYHPVHSRRIYQAKFEVLHWSLKNAADKARKTISHRFHTFCYFWHRSRIFN